MKTHDIRRYRMLVRAREFGIANRELFPAAGRAGQLFAVVSKAVDQLSTYITTQDAGWGASREGAVSKAAAREVLHQAVDAIARTARALDNPGLGGKFQLPSVLNDHELTTKARRFLQDAARLKGQFVAHGLPTSFLADLQASLDGFEQATQERMAAREAGAGAAAGIATAMDAALVAVTRLDAVVANTLRGEPTLLAAWTAARRVGRARAGATREPAQPGTSSPATTPPSAPVKTPQTGEAA